MTIEQTVEIPASRRIFLDLPLELPVGKARVEIKVSPADEPRVEDSDVPAAEVHSTGRVELSEGSPLDAFCIWKDRDISLSAIRTESSTPLTDRLSGYSLQRRGHKP